jgi:hypothetical protein
MSKSSAPVTGSFKSVASQKKPLIRPMSQSTRGQSRDPNAGLEMELARRRALHHVHDAARIILDSLSYATPETAAKYTMLAGQLTTIEQRLEDLAPTR